MKAAAAVAVVAALALAACAHAPDLAVRPELPAPAGEDVAAWSATDGTLLWQRHWLPTAPNNAERGVLVIMHGLADHSDLYDRFARRAAAAGYSVWAFDLRGHGRSAGPRVDAPFDAYVDDLARFIANVHAAEPTQPIFLMGHSMGGAIAALTTIERKPPIAGLILSSAALNLGVSPLTLAGARLAGWLTPHAPGLHLDPDDFASDPAVVAAMKADPLISHDTGPARTAAGLADSTARIWAGIANLGMPLLVLHGTADRLTAPDGSRAFVDAAPGIDRTLHIYNDAWHVLLAEPGHAQVETDVLAWLDAHTGGPAVVAPPIDHARTLRGEPGERVQSLAIGGGLAQGDGGTHGLGELALRLAKLAPLGFAASATVRYLGSGGWDVAVMPLGVSLRAGPAALGLTVGAGTMGPGAHLTIPVGASLDFPLGPVHATASLQLDYLVRGSPPEAALFSSDRAWLGVAVRAPGDRAYWPGTIAGVGPYLAVGLVALESENALQVTAGLALYGAD